MPGCARRFLKHKSKARHDAGRAVSDLWDRRQSPFHCSSTRTGMGAGQCQR